MKRNRIPTSVRKHKFTLLLITTVLLCSAATLGGLFGVLSVRALVSFLQMPDSQISLSADIVHLIAVIVEMMPQKFGIAFLFFATYSTTTVEAQYRSHHRSSSYHRHATAMVQAQKAQMINVLQSQVVLANQILINAVSKSAVSQSLAYEEMSKLIPIRKEREESISTNETRLVEMSRPPASNQNQETLQLRNIVENAKLMVAEREMRLRQLGAKILKSGYGKR